MFMKKNIFYIGLLFVLIKTNVAKCSYYNNMFTTPRTPSAPYYPPSDYSVSTNFSDENNLSPEYQLGQVADSVTRLIHYYVGHAGINWSAEESLKEATYGLIGFSALRLLKVQLLLQKTDSRFKGLYSSGNIEQIISLAETQLKDALSKIEPRNEDEVTTTCCGIVRRKKNPALLSANNDSQGITTNYIQIINSITEEYRHHLGNIEDLFARQDISQHITTIENYRRIHRLAIKALSIQDTYQQSI